MVVQPDQFEIATGKLGERSESGFFEICVDPSIREIGEVKIKVAEQAGYIPAGKYDGVYTYYDERGCIINISDGKGVLREKYIYSVVLFK